MTGECYTISCSSGSPAVGRAATMILRLDGEFDVASCNDLRAALTRVIDAGSNGAIIIDLAGVTFLDCASVGVLLTGYDTAQRRGRDYQLINARGVVHRVLDVLGVLDVILGADNADRRAERP